MTQSFVQGKLPVSVIVAVYNGEKYIGRCLHSILDQSVAVEEVIVVDDGSTDKTADIVQSYAKDHPCVRLFRHGENRGLFAARLTGVLEAMGEYLAFVDADDGVGYDWFRVLYRAAKQEANDITVGRFLCDHGGGINVQGVH